MNSIRIYTSQRFFVDLPVDQHWIQIAHAIHRHFADHSAQWGDDDGQESYEDSPWSQHWNDMMAPRYYAAECVREVFGDDFAFDFDQHNDWLDLEEDMLQLAECHRESAVAHKTLETQE